jgi:hypothetical protein
MLNCEIMVPAAPTMASTAPTAARSGHPGGRHGAISPTNTATGLPTPSDKRKDEQRVVRDGCPCQQQCDALQLRPLVRVCRAAWSGMVVVHQST